MYSSLFLLGFVYLYVSLAHSLSSNLSALALPSSQETPLNGSRLGAWPERVPWTMRLGEGLTMEVFDYGDYAARYEWSGVREGLENIARQINSEQGSIDDHISQNNYEYNIVILRFFGNPPRISKRNALRVLKTIKDLFFVYKDNPRAFVATIGIQGLEIPQNMVLLWNNEPSSWPPLPFTIALQAIQTQPITWFMTFIECGREIGKSLGSEV